MNFTDAEMMGGSGISWTIWKSFAPRSRQTTILAPHHSVFYGLNALSAAQPRAVKTIGLEPVRIDLIHFQTQALAMGITQFNDTWL